MPEYATLLDEACELKAINAGSATTDYMAYQYKYDTIHGKAKGTVEVDGDFLVLNGNKIQTSRCRDPKALGYLWNRGSVL